MPIKQVVRYKGGARDEMIRLAAIGKRCNERHGASSFVLTQVYTGEHAGHWQAEMVFADWATFGHVQEALAKNPESWAPRARWRRLPCSRNGRC